MDIKEGLPFGDEDYGESETKKLPVKSDNIEKITPNQFYNIITSRQPDWQAIIFESIQTEQLDPWDIDIIILTKKYFEKIGELEEADFYISSKVLLAASLLLRLKSEFLLNRGIKDIDEILFGRDEKEKYVVEKIEINEEELPILIPKTPLPRAKRITLSELISALDKAMDTESKRIKREVAVKRAKKLSEIDFPAFQRINLKDRIKQFYVKILVSIKKNSGNNEKHLNKVGYSTLIGKERIERLSCFLPLLHLNNNKKLWVEQEKHLDEIWIYLYEFFEKNRDKFIEELEEDIEEMKQELAEEISQVNIEEITGFNEE